MNIGFAGSCSNCYSLFFLLTHLDLSSNSKLINGIVLIIYYPYVQSYEFEMIYTFFSLLYNFAGDGIFEELLFLFGVLIMLCIPSLLASYFILSITCL